MPSRTKPPFLSVVRTNFCGRSPVNCSSTLTSGRGSPWSSTTFPRTMPVCACPQAAASSRKPVAVPIIARSLIVALLEARLAQPERLQHHAEGRRVDPLSLALDGGGLHVHLPRRPGPVVRPSPGTGDHPPPSVAGQLAAGHRQPQAPAAAGGVDDGHRQ